MSEETDRDLLLRLHGGDEGAFEALFARHYPQVYRAAFALARGHDEADDMAQEAFLALLRQPPPPGAALAAWLCRVALNRGLNAMRGARREQARLGRLWGDAGEEPGAGLLLAEEHAQVRAALASIDERQARMLALRTAGLSYAEVAAAVGVAPGSVGTLLARAERAFLAAYTALERDTHPAA